ncbi:Protein N-acetyltransferase, RimJ/RimL family [Paraburkholderia phenazinium]|uniref:Protein N-acetyltransferase, RimJ/RimL family n=1 Tax=Paraburkholderia phenazinium TaxID=60549 RepID=A0A1G8KD89_9BURK|nr:GNAT family protein [Paraburkholderia phenazinium]SDI41405.1 Protein N-acetyltransferase, RimJ/RimL family [Paraburkholderia phenazinium]
MADDANNLEPVLRGRNVVVEPLQLSHEHALIAAAADGELWNLTLTVVPTAETMARYIERAMAGRSAGTVMPFVIVRREDQRVVGSTRFWKIDRHNRKLEIGQTWLSASVQRSGVNTEAKFLLLRHAFEVMDCVRVQFTTDELNEKSRAAILRIGARQEGIVRHERIMPDGLKRNSVRFSIIDTEWPEVRAGLEQKMARTEG